MPRVGFVTGGGPVAPETSPSLLASIRGRASRAMLEKIYHSTSANCYVCGCRLVSGCGVPLGSMFVLDTSGRYYCTHCDAIFEDGDERTFDVEG